jgi:hypothetical protein
LPTNDFVETVNMYDDLGRLILTKRRTPLGGYDRQATEYDIAGRITRKSEWLSEAFDDSHFKWTVYDFTMQQESAPLPGEDGRYADPLGRIHGVTTPDDLTPSTPTTETTYNGDVTTVIVRDIQGWAVGTGLPVTSTTVYTKDPLGRLVSVVPPGAGATATYSYDESDVSPRLSPCPAFLA